MTPSQLVQERGRHLRPSRRRDGRHLLLPVVVLAALACAAFGYIGYVLWPSSPRSQADAPPLPLTVAGVAFNPPPATIRVAAPLQPRVQARVDLVLLCTC